MKLTRACLHVFVEDVARKTTAIVASIVVCTHLMTVVEIVDTLIHIYKMNIIAQATSVYSLTHIIHMHNRAVCVIPVQVS